MISIKLILILILIAILGFIGIFVATVLWICLSKNDQFDNQFDNQFYNPIKCKNPMDLSNEEGIIFYTQLVRMMESFNSREI
ncbi:hypothetical protein [Gilliamella apicola]|uniref:hypothetical protein n=1 Tax=Gilliamella apicola TaxID=1196095 RepID=UPI000D786178|nr:hypothetical protein [Gilliamella apicola]PXY99065.1 hypothetical protein DKK69_08085 [Gilliamella apicola]WLS92708.1 hypothetical protein RAM21_06100 [Gilliamella apicola]